MTATRLVRLVTSLDCMCLIQLLQKLGIHEWAQLTDMRQGRLSPAHKLTCGTDLKTRITSQFPYTTHCEPLLSASDAQD